MIKFWFLQMFAWVDGSREFIDAVGEERPIGSWKIGDENCPAFIRKALGFPMGWNILDPETSALFRKQSGIKLKHYHLIEGGL